MMWWLEKGFATSIFTQGQIAERSGPWASEWHLEEVLPDVAGYDKPSREQSRKCRFSLTYTERSV